MKADSKKSAAVRGGERSKLIQKVTFGVLEEGKLRTSIRTPGKPRPAYACCCTQNIIPPVSIVKAGAE